MKITFITSTLISGGSERVMSLLANKMSELGHQVEIICLRKQIVFYPINPEVKVLFAASESICDCLPFKVLWLRRYIKSTKPDVVIPFMTAVYCTTIFTLLGVNVPIIASERIDPSHSSVIRKILRRIFLPQVTHLVVQTKDIKRYYSKTIQKKTSVVYNPVSEQVFEAVNVSQENQIISVGRLYHQKNQKMMIDAFDRIKNTYPDYKLVIYGEGPCREELEKYIDELSLKDKVLLPGRSTEVINELRKSKLFCLSSDYEGMSNALIEALCVGLPIITTRVSGAEELITNGENGIIVNVGDVDGLTKAMDSLLRDEVQMNAFSQRNKEKATLFETDIIVNQWINIINAIL